jgi:hypothetical protein
LQRIENTNDYQDDLTQLRRQLRVRDFSVYWNTRTEGIPVEFLRIMDIKEVFEKVILLKPRKLMMKPTTLQVEITTEENLRFVGTTLVNATVKQMEMDLDIVQVSFYFIYNQPWRYGCFFPSLLSHSLGHSCGICSNLLSIGTIMPNGVDCET